MRHRNKTAKLQRTSDHRRALLANLACSLIEHGRIRTTLGKAKALRPVAEKLVTLGKRGDLHARRQAIAFLRHKDVAKKLFNDVAPLAKDRPGGYCRITKLGPRPSDAAPMAIIEWVDRAAVDEDDDDITAEVNEATEETTAAETSSTVEAEDTSNTEVETPEAEVKTEEPDTEEDTHPEATAEAEPEKDDESDDKEKSS